MNPLSKQEAWEIQRATLHLNAQAWGVAFGLLAGFGLFIATIVLVIEAGDPTSASIFPCSRYTCPATA